MSTQITKFSVLVAEIPNPKHYTETQLSGAIEVVKVQLALPDEKPVHYANRPVLEGMLHSLRREQNRRMFGAMVTVLHGGRSRKCVDAIPQAQFVV